VIEAIQLAAKSTDTAITKVYAAIEYAITVADQAGSLSTPTAIKALANAAKALMTTAGAALATDATSVVATGNELIAQNKKAAARKTWDLILDLPTKSGIVDVEAVFADATLGAAVITAQDELADAQSDYELTPSDTTRSALDDALAALDEAKADALALIVGPNLKVTITLADYLAPLIHAEGNIVPTFIDSSFRLDNSERSKREFIPVLGDLTTGYPSLPPDTSTIEFEYTLRNTDLTDIDVYALLAFNVRYYPFGKPAAGKAWTLRNGLDNALIDNGQVPPDSLSSVAGGAAYVTIGKGGDLFEDGIPLGGSY
jgi:hypothetical protein